MLVSLARLPALGAARFGDRAAIKCGDEVRSWSELDALATQRAWAMKRAGVVEGDLVTLALANGAPFFELAFAIWKLGATPHVVSHRLPKPEMDAIVDLAQPRLFIGPGARDFGVGESVEHELPDVVSRRWKAMSSGGSTGRPKIIVAQQPAAFDLEHPRMRLPQAEAIINPGPLYHNAPMSLSIYAMLRGNTVITMPKFDAEGCLALIAEQRPSWAMFVPTMMGRMWRLDEDVRARYDLSSLRTVWHMGGPMPPVVKRAWLDWIGPEKVWELYGSTENIGSTIASGVEWLERPGTVGRPLDCEVSVFDDNGQPAKAGEVGEIFFRAPGGANSTYAYIGAESRHGPEGFESIGDFGWVDEDGYVFLADRRTDMIVSGGANLYPAEIEGVLAEHPGIDEAVVIGLPDNDLGAVAHAIVRSLPGHDLSASALEIFLAERLERRKTPRSFEFVSDSLRDEAGKVRRSQLRAERLPYAK